MNFFLHDYFWLTKKKQVSSKYDLCKKTALLKSGMSVLVLQISYFFNKLNLIEAELISVHELNLELN